MVVIDPLEFNFLLGWDYVYDMNVVLSTPFCEMWFPHDGYIVSIDKILFVGLELTNNHSTSLSVLNVQVVSSLPQLNYVATYPIHVPIIEYKPFAVFITSFDQDLVGDMVNHLLGAFEYNISIGSFHPF